jgi:hypothetical protein
VPSTAEPSAFFSWVTLTRHSPAWRCGRTIAPRRGKRNSPAASAASINAGIVRHASPARRSSTAPTRNISVG